jgi:predicted RNA-binding protein with PIN domain
VQGCRPVLLIDGMNVIGSRPTGWWRDLPGAVRGLVVALGRYADERDETVLVVFDGEPVELPGLPAGLRVEFASEPERGAADRRIAEIAEERGPEARVVTSDRELAERVRAAGAEVIGAGGFRRELDRS